MGILNSREADWWCLLLHPVTKLGCLWFLSDRLFSIERDSSKLRNWWRMSFVSALTNLKGNFPSAPNAVPLFFSASYLMRMSSLNYIFFNQVVSIMQIFHYSAKSWTLEKWIFASQEKNFLFLTSLFPSLALSLFIWCNVSFPSLHPHTKEMRIYSTALS